MDAEKCTLIPEQLFESQDAFIAHVKQFAVENGFNVRLDDVERDKGGSIRKRDIVCSSEGTPRSKEPSSKGKDSVPRSEADADADGDTDSMEAISATSKSVVAHSGAHRRTSMKTGCRWLARASRQPSGMWKVILLRLKHNHQLAARYELLTPSAHIIRTGDNSSISAAALAAHAASERGVYTSPSIEFKNLFLQMSAACADLCWSAARHPSTISEVLSEIRRLNQHLDKHSGFENAHAIESSGSTNHGAVLPTIVEDAVDRNSDVLTGDSERTATNDGSLVMMANAPAMAVDHRVASVPSHPQPSHFLSGARATPSQHNGVAAQSPELNGTGIHPPTFVTGANMLSESAAMSPSSESASAANSSSTATGPAKRSRGRPRKNPLTADGRPAKSKAQQRREQKEQEHRQQLVHVQPNDTPTPADLVSLSQKINTQVPVASTPVSMQRSINSSLTLPSKPMQVHSHAASRASILASNPTVPPIIDARSHVNPIQRQQQQPQPQPQQSPTFFLGAAEGNGYPKHSAATDPESTANVEYSSTAAAAATAYSGAPAAMGYTAFHASQKSAAASRTAAAAAAAPAPVPAPAPGVPKHATTTTAAAAADAASNSNAIRRRRLPSSAVPPPTSSAAATTTAAAAEPVPRSTAISAISNPATNAPPSVNFGVSDERSRAAAASAALPMYHQTYQQTHHAQELHAYYHQRSQPASANSVGSPAPVSTINQLVLPSSSSIPVSASSVTAVAITPQQQHQQQQQHQHQQSYHYQQQPQPNMFHLNPAMQATAHQVNRDPTPAHLDQYLLMARAQQQRREQEQQQQQQHNYHVQKQQQAATTSDHSFVDVGSHQSPTNTLSTLPPMAHGNGMMPSTANRRFEDIQLGQYQGMNNWQV